MEAGKLFKKWLIYLKFKIIVVIIKLYWQTLLIKRMKVDILKYAKKCWKISKMNNNM